MRQHLAFGPKQAGDTIVEVLIASAVVGLILVGAFVLSSQSSRGVRNSQEHSEALQLLQSQVEQVRSVADSVSFPGAGTPFCMVGSAPSTTCSLQGDGSDGSPCTDNICYTVSIVRDAPIASTGTTPFHFTVNWDALGGGSSQESLIYRIKVANP